MLFLEEFIVAQMAKKFPTFHGTWRIINIFTRTCNCTLSWATWSSPHPQTLFA